MRWTEMRARRRARRARALLEWLASLADRDRDPYLLIAAEGLSSAAAAERLNLTATEVEKAFARALSSLAARMDGDDGR